MVINLNAEQVYLSVIVILMALQVYQYFVISKLRAQMGSIWMQIAMMALSISNIIEKDKNIQN